MISCDGYENTLVIFCDWVWHLVNHYLSWLTTHYQYQRQNWNSPTTNDDYIAVHNYRLAICHHISANSSTGFCIFPRPHFPNWWSAQGAWPQKIGKRCIAMALTGGRHSYADEWWVSGWSMVNTWWNGSLLATHGSQSLSLMANFWLIDAHSISMVARIWWVNRLAKVLCLAKVLVELKHQKKHHWCVIGLPMVNDDWWLIK